MKHIVDTIHPSTDDVFQVVDLTEYIKTMVANSGIQHGIVTIASQHTTSALVIGEKEGALLKDMMDILEEIASKDRYYRHDDPKEREGTPEAHKNGWSHVRSFFLGTSQSIPLIEGILALGPWQSILFFDFDGPHQTRNVVVQIVGE